jgi:hypothetical protein
LRGTNTGRKPIIREAIRRVLKKSSDPLRFKEIRDGVADELGRKKEEVGDQNIFYNLSILVKQGEVEETSIKSKKAYCLSSSFYKAKNKTFLKFILDAADLGEFFPNFESNNPPLSAYFENLQKLIDPLREKPVQHFSNEINNWNEPIDLIRRRMLESYTDLEVEERTGIAKLLAHAYWFGTQELIKNYDIEPLDKALLRSRSFALKCIENAKRREDFARIEAENIIIQILDITGNILSAKNLKELIFLFQKRSLEIKNLQNQMLSLTGQYMAAGEKIFDTFQEFHACTLSGLEAADLIPKGVKKSDIPYKYRYLMNYADVWDDIISSIISEFNSQEDLESIKGDLGQTLDNIKKYKKHLFPFIDLPFRSRMFVFYVWGYPEVFEVSDKDFLPFFDEWLSALKKGYLDHRSWIFSGESITALINSFKEVKKGRIPADGIIDIEPWTIRDLYYFHPRGKDVSFWRELLVELNSRLQLKQKNRRFSQHIEAVLEGGY